LPCFFNKPDLGHLSTPDRSNRVLTR
jgi:hypothetical protein